MAFSYASLLLASAPVDGGDKNRWSPHAFSLCSIAPGTHSASTPTCSLRSIKKSWRADPECLYSVLQAYHDRVWSVRSTIPLTVPEPTDVLGLLKIAYRRRGQAMGAVEARCRRGAPRKTFPFIGRLVNRPYIIKSIWSKGNTGQPCSRILKVQVCLNGRLLPYTDSWRSSRPMVHVSLPLVTPLAWARRLC